MLCLTHYNNYSLALCNIFTVFIKREAVTEANRLQLELTGIRESQDKEKEHLLMSHEEELKLLRDQLLQKDKAIEVEIGKRSNLEKEIKQLQEKEQLDVCLCVFA